MKEVVRTESAPAPFQGAPYSQAIKANGFVFVAGQVGIEPDNPQPVGEGIRAQTEQTLMNLRAANPKPNVAYRILTHRNAAGNHPGNLLAHRGHTLSMFDDH